MTGITGDYDFWLAATVDTTNWSLRRTDIPDWYNPSQPAILHDSTLSIHFWDERRGLIGVYGRGFALTSDAGKTWHPTANPGFGELLFTGRKDGWLLGSSAKYEYNGGLFVTRDGAQSWRQVLLPGPRPDEANAAYGLPTFTDKSHAFCNGRLLRSQDSVNCAVSQHRRRTRMEERL